MGGTYGRRLQGGRVPVRRARPAALRRGSGRGPRGDLGALHVLDPSALEAEGRQARGHGPQQGAPEPQGPGPGRRQDADEDREDPRRALVVRGARPDPGPRPLPGDAGPALLEDEPHGAEPRVPQQDRGGDREGGPRRRRGGQEALHEQRLQVQDLEDVSEAGVRRAVPGVGLRLHLALAGSRGHLLLLGADRGRRRADLRGRHCWPGNTACPPRWSWPITTTGRPRPT